MAKLSEETMRPVEVKVAAAICRMDGGYDWKYLRDIDGNPSTSYAYYKYLRMGRAIVRLIEKMYAGGAVARRMQAEKGNV